MATENEDGVHRANGKSSPGKYPILATAAGRLTRSKPGERHSVLDAPEQGRSIRYALLESLTTADGTVLRRVFCRPLPTETTTDISGIWKSRLEPDAPIEVLSGLFAEFMTVPVTETGQESMDTYDHDRENPNAVCYGYGLVAGLTSPHYLNEIEILDDRVIIRDEWFDAERVVHTDGREHPEDGERTRLGHSIGHWEGDTLVVDTRLFAPHRSPYGIGLASGTDKHVVERYTLNDDGRSLTLEVFIEDPEYLGESFSGTLNWDYTPDFDFYRYDCDPEVATRFSLP